MPGGLRKAKKYDWNDSNMALFGSDTEKQVKKESAESEPAWQGAGAAPGLRVWRIVKFKVTDWDEPGDFYDGDSYIILNTYKADDDSEKLLHDVHFWIGKYSSQDEYGTAAYKTVELDTFLDDVPVQHREVMGHESSMFKSYFETMTILKGGAESGFRRVVPEAYTIRLFRVRSIGKGMKNVEITEVASKRGSVNDEDVFILDTGDKIIQLNGGTASKEEKFMASQYAQKLRSDRCGKPELDVIESHQRSRFERYVPEAEDADSDGEDEGEDPPKLIRIHDRESSVVAEGEGCLNKELLDSDDVFIIDTGSGGVFVWVGAGASVDERKNSMAYAHKHLQECQAPWRAVTVVSEQQAERAKDFQAIW